MIPNESIFCVDPELFLQSWQGRKMKNGWKSNSSSSSPVGKPRWRLPGSALPHSVDRERRPFFCNFFSFTCSGLEVAASSRARYATAIQWLLRFVSRNLRCEGVVNIVLSFIFESNGIVLQHKISIYLRVISSCKTRCKWINYSLWTVLRMQRKGGSSA